MYMAKHAKTDRPVYKKTRNKKNNKHLDKIKLSLVFQSNQQYIYQAKQS